MNDPIIDQVAFAIWKVELEPSEDSARITMAESEAEWAPYRDAARRHVAAHNAMMGRLP